MKLWCYGEDHGKWGQHLAFVARKCGIDAHIFRTPDGRMRKGDYVFMRIPQWEPELSVGKALAKYLFGKGMKLIPDYFTISCYENKLLQTQAYSEWMPETHLLRSSVFDTWHDAERAIESIGLPFISKSREGSSSVNVRMIKNYDEAQIEWASVMEGPGRVINTGDGNFGRQLDYLIWQKFCPDNPCDYRVCINGDKLLMLRRFNTHGSSFASGSGRNEPVTTLCRHTKAVLHTAKDFFDAFGLKWNGIDLVRDTDGEWKVLETTLGWSLPAYQECEYFGTNYKGKDIWGVLCDALKRGVFG